MNTIQTPGAPHPQVRVDQSDAAAGTCVFAWLDADGNQIDSGGSVARFAPLAALEPLAEFVPNPDATPEDAEAAQAARDAAVDAWNVELEAWNNVLNARIAAAIITPAPVVQTVFDYSQFTAHCDARVPGFTERVLVAARGSAAVQNWVNVAVSRNAVHLDSPDLAAAFGLFVAAGLMTANERTLILAS